MENNDDSKSDVLEFGKNNSENSAEKSSSTEFKPLGDFDTRRVRRKDNLNRKNIIIISGMLLFAVLVVIGIVWAAVSQIAANHTQIDESTVKADPALATTRTKDDGMSKMMAQFTRQEEAAPPPPPPAQVSKPDTTNQSQSTSGTGNAGTAQVQQQERKEESLFGMVNRFDAGGLSAGSSGSSNDAPDLARTHESYNGTSPGEDNQAGVGLGNLAGPSRGSELDNLTGSQYAQAKAYRMPNPKFLLKRRTSFQCVLYTGIKTDHPGFVGCRLTRPLYSADGSVILAEAGAELNGEQKVELKSGQSSLFTSWTDLETAPGVRASLNGLGTDSMGRSGTDAYINNHYGQRFGGAIMLSFIQDALQSAANLTQRSSGDGFTINNSEQNAENMATKALENSINIPPTGYVLPGTVINVIVAQDIDFSTVFQTR